MPAKRRASLEEVRGFYAAQMAAASRSVDARLERIFAQVPREAFLPAGPWQIMVNDRYVETPSADPIYVNQNNVVALDAAKGINNGEPFLHAAWIGAVAPQPGEIVCHIGTGTGYYTALLAMLVLPGGAVHAFEIDACFAKRAQEILASFEIVSVTQGDATQRQVPSSDVIYVNAGVAAPPLSWLRALRPNGRLIFPWRPAEPVALAVVVTRSDRGFAMKPLMPAWFIPCVGASSIDACAQPPTKAQAWSARSVWATGERSPDESAVAVYKDVWFSSIALDSL